MFWIVILCNYCTDLYQWNKSSFIIIKLQKSTKTLGLKTSHCSVSTNVTGNKTLDEITRIIQAPYTSTFTQAYVPSIEERVIEQRTETCEQPESLSVDSCSECSRNN